MSETVSAGGCACGAVRYEFTGQPAVVFNCHCHECQRTSGGAFFSAVVVPGASYRLTRGTLSYYTVKGDSGMDIRRGFCAKCGSRVAGTLEARPDIVAIALGSLDNPAAFKPQVNFYTDHKLPWVRLQEDTKNFPRAMTG